MEISRSPAVLKPFRIRSSSTRGRPGGLPPEQVATVEAVLEIKATGEILATQTMRHLFPFAEEAVKLIAGREEDDRRGMDLYGRGRIADINITIHDCGSDDKTGRGPIIKGVVVGVIGRTRLAIDELGDGTLMMKVCGLFTAEQIAVLSSYVAADVWVTTSMSLPLFDASKKPIPIKDGKPDPAHVDPVKPTTSKRAKGKGGEHDAILDGVLVTVGKKEALRAEGAAGNSGGRYDFAMVLKAARTAARLSAEPGQETVPVTRDQIDAALEALDAAAAEAEAEASAAGAVH